MLAMSAGLLWSRWWTGVCTAIAAVAFVALQGSSLAHGSGWATLAGMLLGPWLLAAQQDRHEQVLKGLHVEEAKRMTRLSESTRSLLALQQSTQELEGQIASITDVYHVTKATAKALHLSELFSGSLDVASRFLDARGLRLIDLSQDAPNAFRAAKAADGRMMAAQEEPALNEMEQTVVEQLRSASRSSNGAARMLSCAVEGLSRVAWAPLWREQQPIGVLVADELPEGQLKMLAMIANQLSLQLSRIRLYEQVEALAVTDALTGLSVRRHFMERAGEELKRSHRHELPCTVLMADLDRFKEKNDTYGHLVGDVVLRDVARLLKRNLRDIDLIARFGGEEVIMLLIETGMEQAIPIAQRLKQLVEVHPIRAYDELLMQTVSIGMAEFPQDGKTLEEIIERADQALYAAKRAGRNQVVRWTTAC